MHEAQSIGGHSEFIRKAAPENECCNFPRYPRFAFFSLCELSRQARHLCSTSGATARLVKHTGGMKQISRAKFPAVFRLVDRWKAADFFHVRLCKLTQPAFGTGLSSISEPYKANEKDDYTYHPARLSTRKFTLNEVMPDQP